MKYYYGLTNYGLWIWFRSKNEINDCEAASKICGEIICKVEPVPLFFRIFHFLYLDKEGRRGK